MKKTKKGEAKLEKDLVMDGKPDMSKSQKGHLVILEIGKYKDADYILQKMGDAFQFLAIWNGKFYQGYTIMKPEDVKKGFTQTQLVELAVLTHNFMETTIDTLVATKERDDKKAKKKKLN